MTAIVVVKKNNKVCIAADTAVTVNGVIENASINTHHDKIFQYKDNYFAYTGNAHSYMMVKLALEQHGDSWEFNSIDNIYKSLLELHRTLKEHFFTKTDTADQNQSVEDSHLSYLLANPSGIYQFYGDRYVGEINTYWSCGSGSRLALGAMDALYEISEDPVTIAKAGIQAACKFDQHCELPLTQYSCEVIPQKTLE
ncbi:MAG: Unknown protein [uncultured Thiotrichaceae bacterium]|uniref:MFS transporter n=1 Tax=uncultured Thiotrichaceae bacterium TaxID=298394 RepID=A0A6S6SET3_9GAMM|nr:MAG: Unknown protein [uncultured Thiotrichaceae bacterium]